jgi:ribonuclease HII
MVSLKREHELWNSGLEHVAGVDEAGRGPLAGPVVAAAVVFPKGVWIEGVNDSKLLKEAKRENLFEKIRSAALAVGVGIVPNEEIDRINILQAAMFAMRYALEKLEVQPEFALIDGNQFSHDSLRYETFVDGDALSFTIAAASIVAKVTRDRLMRSEHERFPQYGFDRHKGYGTQQHRDAIRKFGLCEIHRRSFCRNIFST